MKVLALYLFAFVFCGLISWARADQPAFKISLSAASTTITTAAYVELDSATDASCNKLSVWNSTTQPIYLAIGASGAENIIKYDVAPGGGAVHLIHQPLARGVRLTARAVGADAATGYLIVNCLQ